jgi:predicted GNAT family acetyltransferase
MTKFSEVKDTNTTQFTQAAAIYTESIPASERQTIDTIKERITSGKEKLYIGEKDGEVSMMALLYPLEGTQFVLLDYMAVKEAHRKHGVGSEFVKKINEITGFKNKLFIIEVEDPKTGTAQEQETRQRRVYFYRKNGAKILKHVRYILPPLQGNTPTDMILLVISQNNRLLWIAGDAIKEAVVQIYSELYGRGEADQLLAPAIESIQPQVTLQ